MGGLPNKEGVSRVSARSQTRLNETVESFLPVFSFLKSVPLPGPDPCALLSHSPVLSSALQA